MFDTTFRVVVSGDYACFTRPEFKFERVTYEVPTPGACEGILKCIYWKPSMRYVIDKIVVMNAPKFDNIFKNEIRDKVSMKKVLNAKYDPTLYASELRVQRNNMVLRDVKYCIEGHIELTDLRCSEEIDAHKTDEGRLIKHYTILCDRLKKGQCFKQPFLGIREYGIRQIKLVKELPEGTATLNGVNDLGRMLYRLNFKDNGVPMYDDWELGIYDDTAVPEFYHPVMVDGVIDVAKCKEVSKC